MWEELTSSLNIMISIDCSNISMISMSVNPITLSWCSLSFKIASMNSFMLALESIMIPLFVSVAVLSLHTFSANKPPIKAMTTNVST